jgi:hypothetical protein
VFNFSMRLFGKSEAEKQAEAEAEHERWVAECRARKEGEERQRLEPLVKAITRIEALNPVWKGGVKEGDPNQMQAAILHYTSSDGIDVELKRYLPAWY